MTLQEDKDAYWENVVSRTAAEFKVRLDCYAVSTWVAEAKGLWNETNPAELEQPVYVDRTVMLLRERIHLAGRACVEFGVAPLPRQAFLVPGDLLAFGRYLVPRRDRETIDLIRLDLREDAGEMLERGYSKRRVQFLITWHSLTSLAPYFWRGIRNLLPFKKVGWEDEQGPRAAQ